MDWQLTFFLFLVGFAFFIGDAEGIARGYLHGLANPSKIPIHTKALIVRRERHLRIGGDPGEQYGKILWQWPTPFDYDPPEGATGEPPKSALSDIAGVAANTAKAMADAAKGKPRGRPRETVWPPSAKDYFKTVDEFYKFIGQAIESLERKDGIFAFLCSDRSRPIPEGTARGWIRDGWKPGGRADNSG